MIVCTSRDCGCKKDDITANPDNHGCVKMDTDTLNIEFEYFFFEIQNHKFLPHQHIAAEEPGAHN